MNKLTRIQVLAVSLLALATTVCSAADVELTATTKTASPDGNVTTYSGDVTLKVPAGTALQLRGKAMKREKGLEILRGEVEIRLDTMIVRTQQASVSRNAKMTVVKMDAAEVTKVTP